MAARKLTSAWAVFTALILSACSSSFNEVPGLGAFNAAVTQNQAVKPPGACDLPWGGFLTSGQSTTGYTASTYSCPDSCTNHSTLLSCNNGVLSGDANTYNVPGCREVGCSPCPLPSPQVGYVSEGTQLNLYSAPSVACGKSCAAIMEQRNCANGALSGDSQFVYNSCTASKCPCTLPDGSGTVADGSQINAFNATTVNCGKCSDHEVILTCSNGSWLGGDTSVYKSLSCTAVACRNCTLGDGTSVASGASVTAYNTSTALACKTSCSASAETRTCTDGTLTGDAPYQYSKCTDTNCPCALPWGQSLPDGKTTTAYSQATVGCNVSCTGVAATLSCANGTLLSSTGAPTNFTNQSCSTASCTCTTPTGGTVNVGATWTGYNTTNVACGQTCTADAETFTCVAGNKLVASDGVTLAQNTAFINQACTVNGGHSCSCTLPWGTGLANGGTTSGYKTNITACAVGCTANGNSTTFTCTNGTLASSTDNQSAYGSIAGSPFIYSGCSPQSCSGTGGGSGGGEGDGTGRGRQGGGAPPPPPPPGGSCGGAAIMCPNQYSSAYPNASCQIPWTNPPPAGVAPEYGMGGFLAIGDWIPAFRKSSVACGERCEDQMVMWHCPCEGNPESTTADGPLYPSCTEPPAGSCQ